MHAYLEVEILRVRSSAIYIWKVGLERHVLVAFYKAAPIVLLTLRSTKTIIDRFFTYHNFSHHYHFMKSCQPLTSRSASFCVPITNIYSRMAQIFAINSPVLRVRDAASRALILSAKWCLVGCSCRKMLHESHVRGTACGTALKTLSVITSSVESFHPHKSY